MNFIKLVICSLILVRPLAAEPLSPDTSRPRELTSWKRQITVYSKRHYGEATWKLEPKCIVLHYTAGAAFPWNLVNTSDFDGESPGLASHYVIDGSHLWELLPPTVRSRGAYGVNHRGINIEMVGKDGADLATRSQTLETCARLVLELMERFKIPLEHIYSHQQVATMDTGVCPFVLDKVRPDPYHKIDPGDQNMATILARVKQLRARASRETPANR